MNDSAIETQYNTGTIDFGDQINGYLARFTGTLNREGTYTIHYEKNNRVNVSIDAIAYVIKENFGNYIIIIDGDKIFVEELSFLNNKDVKLQALTYECVVGEPNSPLYPVDGGKPIYLHEGDKIVLVETNVEEPEGKKIKEMYDLVYYKDNKDNTIYGKFKRGDRNLELEKSPTLEKDKPYNLGCCIVKKGTKINYASKNDFVILEKDKRFFAKKVQGDYDEIAIAVKSEDGTWTTVKMENILEWKNIEKIIRERINRVKIGEKEESR